MGFDGAVTHVAVDVPAAIDQARCVQQQQRERAEHCVSGRPDFPAHAFGQGLAPIVQVLEQALGGAQDVAVDHAHRVQQAAIDGEAWAQRVGDIDQRNQAIFRQSVTPGVGL